MVQSFVLSYIEGDTADLKLLKPMTISFLKGEKQIPCFTLTKYPYSLSFQTRKKIYFFLKKWMRKKKKKKKRWGKTKISDSYDYDSVLRLSLFYLTPILLVNYIYLSKTYNIFPPKICIALHWEGKFTICTKVESTLFKKYFGNGYEPISNP